MEGCWCRPAPAAATAMALPPAGDVVSLPVSDAVALLCYSVPAAATPVPTTAAPSPSLLPPQTLLLIPPTQPTPSVSWVRLDMLAGHKMPKSSKINNHCY